MKLKKAYFNRPKGIQKYASELIFGDSSSTKQIYNLIKSLNKNSKVLFIGAAEKTKLAEIAMNNFDYFGLDIYKTEYVTHIGDAQKMLFKDNFFNLVVIQSVLEHLQNPEKCANEIYRVLKTNGYLYSEAPFMQEVHEPGSDFLRFSPEAHIYLFRKLKILNIEITKGIGYNMLWSLRYFISTIIRNKKIAGLLCFPFLWLRYFEKIIPHSQFLWDGCSETAILAKKSKNISPIKNILKIFSLKKFKYKKVSF